MGIACRYLSLFLPICFTKSEQKRLKQHLKSKFAGQREPGHLWEQRSLPTRLLGSTLETETDSPQGQEKIHYELLILKQPPKG